MGTGDAELTPDVLLVVTKKATQQPEKTPVAVPAAGKSQPVAQPIVAEKAAVAEERKPDSRPRTPLQAVGRSSATES